MPPIPCCPTCHTPHHGGETTPGTLLFCEACQEVFEVGAAGAEPLPVAEVIHRPTAKPVRRGDNLPRAKPVPRDDPGTAPREDRSRETRILLLLGGMCLVFLFVVLGLIGGGVWIVAKKVEQNRAARAEREEREAEARQEEERIRKNEELLRWRKEKDEWLLKKPEAVTNPNPWPAHPLPDVEISPPPREVPEREVPVLPAFAEPVNPYKAGTQTKLRELRAVDLPKLPAPAKPQDNHPGYPVPINDYTHLVHSPRHQLLFALAPKCVCVYDLKAGKAIGTQEAKQVFTDISLSPDQSAVFVADYGERLLGDPMNPSRVHRFDCATRKWEDRKAPRIAWGIEAVDAGRVLLLEANTWVDVTLNKWEEDGIGIRELSRTKTNYTGDFQYDSRTGRIYHGNRALSSQEITVRVVDGNALKPAKGTGTYGTATGGGPTVVLSQDGSRLYYGALQVSAADVGKNQRWMRQEIYAASRDVAFGMSAYYRATDGEKLGEFEFKIYKIDPQRGWQPLVINVSPDGMSVWVIDRDKNVARQFALEGEK
jgi:hypothetical protein